MSTQSSPLTASGASTMTRPDTSMAVANLIRFLETGTAPDGLFAADAFADLSLPQWRIQIATGADIIALRHDQHPFPGQVHVERVSSTDDGFVIEFEERWVDQGQQWYCREMIRADVVAGSIVELSIYCTGDWDEARQREHAEAVHLLRS